MRKLLPVGCIRYSLRMGFKTLSFFCPVLGGPPGEAGSAPLRRADRCGVSCRRRSGSSVSPVGSPSESGVFGFEVLKGNEKILCLITHTHQTLTQAPNTGSPVPHSASSPPTPVHHTPVRLLHLLHSLTICAHSRCLRSFAFHYTSSLPVRILAACAHTPPQIKCHGGFNMPGVIHLTDYYKGN